MTGIDPADLARLSQRFRDIDDRLMPEMNRLALNDMAFKVHAENKELMRRSFNNPTPWTLNAFFVRKATRGYLVAEVLRKDAQRGRHYLETQQTGGKRGLTGLERLFKERLKYDGLIVSVLPTKALRKNKYGNVAKSRMQQIISGVQAQGDATQNTSVASRKRSKGKRAEYFVPKADGKLSAGVYERKGDKIAKVLAFSDKAPTYRKRFPMEKHAERVATDAAPIATERAFNRVMSSIK